MTGRVELYTCGNDTWDTICSYNWDYLDAAVVCRELNFSAYGKPQLAGLW